MAEFKLKGKYTEVSVVEGYDDTETETLLGLVTDTVTIGGEEETIEANGFMMEITEREVISGAPFIQVSSWLDPDMSILQETGVLDEDGDWTTQDRTIEAVRVRNYENMGDADPALTIDGVDCEPMWEDDAEFVTDDFAIAGVTFHVNGSLKVNPDSGAE